MPVFAREMKKQGLDPNGRIIRTAQGDQPPNVEVDMLNCIYNACDVGVNTCKGEGWGLVNFEHAACKVAQIVPNHTSCKEIFEGYGKLIRCDHIDVDTNYAREMPCPSGDHLAELLTELYESPGKREAVAELCHQRATDPQFAWETVASQFGGIFEDVLQEVDHGVELETVSKRKKKKTKRTKKKLAEVS